MQKHACFPLVVFMLVFVLAGHSPAASIPEELRDEFFCRPIDPNPDKPAWINPCDIDGDGKTELIVSVFAGSSPMGAGYLTIYKMKGSDIFDWEKRMVEGSAGVRFPNDTTVADVDSDGDADIILPSGFLATAPKDSGALAWFENRKDKWAKHEICLGMKKFYHFAEYLDLDGDGVADILTVGERKPLMGGAGEASVHLFRGLGNGEFSSVPEKLADALGSLPAASDIDGDGDVDLIGAQYFLTDCNAAWLENSCGSFKKHVIAKTQGPSIQLSVIDNLCGDGKKVAVLANHVNSCDNPSGPKEGVFLLEVPESAPALVSEWRSKLISSGIKSRKSPMGMPQGAPGIFKWGDVNGDGDIDIVVAGDGDPCVYLLEQAAPYEFRTRKLLEGMPQGGVAVADLDSDGIAEIIASSYENNSLYIVKKR